MSMQKKRPGLSLAKTILIVVAVMAGTTLAVLAYRLHDGRFSMGASRETALQTLETARKLIDEGRWEDAHRLIDPLSERLRNNPLNQQALLLLARVEKEMRHSDKALAHLKRAATEFLGAPGTIEAKLAYARLLEECGQKDDALRAYGEIRDSAPPEVRAPATTALGREAESQKDLLKARDWYAQAVREAQWDSEAWQEASAALGRVNVALIFSPMETPESRKYAVQPKDNLLDIGIKLNTTQGLLMRANGLSETTVLSVGQQLKHTPKDFRIVIDRSKCRLYLLDKDGVFKWYRTGLGMPGHETTLGAYKIGNKQKDPIWHKPGAGPIPAGDPANELGTRWMPLLPQLEGLPTDLGIHGTIKPETVGTFASHGCARLLNEEVEELYDLVVRSTPVDIVEVFSTPAGG